MDMKGRRVKRSRVRGGKKRFRKLYEEMERKAIRFVLPEFIRKPRKVRSGAPEAAGWAYISLGFQYARGQCSRINNLGPIRRYFCIRSSTLYFTLISILRSSSVVTAVAWQHNC
jgi:hypothetical protein